MSQSFLSLNVERDKHYDLIVPFLKERKPDIACFQEIYEKDLAIFTEALGEGSITFVPMNKQEEDVQGVAIFTRTAPESTGFAYYHGDGTIVRHDKSNLEDNYATQNLVLLVADIVVAGYCYRIATTHFTWTPDGEVNDMQRKDMEALMPLLEKEGELILCGDFNAARGKEIFSAFAARYKDNIPEHYTSSIDGTIHRAGNLPYMVDVLFTTPGYTATDVALVGGVSDHCAVVATVTSSLSN